VLFEAFDHVLGGDSADDTSRPPVERALWHEEEYWKVTAPGRYRDADSIPLLRACAGLATLASAIGDADGDALLAVLEPLAGDAAALERRRLADWYASLYHGPGKLNPLLPDRLGEGLV
jgi:hypothetical protein